MRQLTVILLVAAVILLACGPVVAQLHMPYSVLGSGGGRMGGASHAVLGTLGQPVIGVVSGPSNVNEIGFWYRPGWILTGIDGEDVLPAEYWFGQNHPNPFNPLTTLEFALPGRAPVEIRLYDAGGRLARVLVDAEFDAGFHRVVLDAGGLASGVYFTRMVAGEFIETRKLVVLK